MADKSDQDPPEPTMSVNDTRTEPNTSNQASPPTALNTAKAVTRMDNRSAYEAMKDWQLKDLGVKYRIPQARRVDEHGEHFYFDREQMIRALLNHDALRFGQPPQSILPAERPSSFRLKGQQCDPRFWRNFSYEKTSKTSKFRESLIYKFVSLSIPAHRTNRDVVEQVAKGSQIPIESLADDLNWPVFSRGQAIFGFAGDEFDKIADNYDNMQWWVSDAGLNVGIASPENPTPSIPTLDELLGGQLAVGEEWHRNGRKSARRNPRYKLIDEAMKESQEALITPVAGEKRLFKKTGEVWSLQFSGISTSVQDRIGMVYVAHLLRSPGRSFNCMELQAAASRNPGRPPMLDGQGRSELPVDEAEHSEILDATARQQYKERLGSIEEELREAESNNDTGLRDLLTSERQKIIDELRAAIDVRGRSRNFAGPSENARKAVSGAIKNALKKIRKHHARLAEHLEERIELGSACCYKGDGTDWEV